MKCDKCQGLGCRPIKPVRQPGVQNFEKCAECSGTGVVGGKPNPDDAGQGDCLEIRQFKPEE